MGETSYQIERHINQQREHLGDNLDELEHKIRSAVDWRAQMQVRPMAMVALAFGGGMLLSALLPAASRRPPGRAEVANRPNESWADLKSALLSAVTAKWGGLIDGVLPGFSEQFTQARSVRFSKRDS
jgi:hypothetical protein